MINPALDAADLRILKLLQEDASRSIQALAQAAHLSPATCHRRLQRLHQQGLVERTVALLNAERLRALSGQGLDTVIEVSLDEQAQEKLDAFEHKATRCEEVMQCWRVSGGPDFILMVHVTDMAAYNRFTQALLGDDLNVRNVRAFFCTRRAKFSTAYPLPGGTAPTAAPTAAPSAAR